MFFFLGKFSLKTEIDKLHAEHNEDIAQRQHKYKLEINSLKDQLLESDARRESLEREVSFNGDVLPTFPRSFGAFGWIDQENY